MGYDDGFDFEDEQDAPKGPKGLREAYDALKKKYGDLEAAHREVSGQVTERNLKDVLEGKGLRPALARVMKADGVDVADAAAIETWLNTPANQEDFAFSLAAEGDGSSDQGGDESPEGADEHTELADAHRRMQAATAGALPPNKFSEASAQIGQAESLDQIQAALDAALKATPMK